MKFSIKDLVTFTKEILHGKLHFLCSADKHVAETTIYFTSNMTRD